MQEQTDNVSGEMKFLSKNQKEMLKIKNTVTEMKNAFDGLSSRLDIVEERISELEHITVETYKTEKQREKRLNKTKWNIQELWDNYRRCNICIIEISEEEREKEIEAIKTNNLPQINVRYQTTDPRSSENTRMHVKKPTIPAHIIFKLQKINDKAKIFKEARGKYL